MIDCASLSPIPPATAPPPPTNVTTLAPLAACTTARQWRAATTCGGIPVSCCPASLSGEMLQCAMAAVGPSHHDCRQCSTAAGGAVAVMVWSGRSMRLQRAAPALDWSEQARLARVSTSDTNCGGSGRRAVVIASAWLGVKRAVGGWAGDGE